MSLYRIDQYVQNPLTGESRRISFQFDPATVTQAQWDGVWPSVQNAINSLLASGATSEPATLASAATKPVTFP